MELVGKKGDKHIIKIQIGPLITEVRAKVSKRTIDLFKVTGEQMHRQLSRESLQEEGITSAHKVQRHEKTTTVMLWSGGFPD